MTTTARPVLDTLSLHRVASVTIRPRTSHDVDDRTYSVNSIIIKNEDGQTFTISVFSSPDEEIAFNLPAFTTATTV